MSRHEDNPAAFKHAYSPEKVAAIGQMIASVAPRFDRARFLAVALPGLTELPMKARVDAVARAIHEALPVPFPSAAEALTEALGPPGAPSGKAPWGPAEPSGEGLSGFQVWPLTRFVARYGLDHHDASMAALREMTRRWTAEFALRPFLAAEPVRTLAVLTGWVRSSDQHLRRAASESTRPRLPWGSQLRAFIADPSPVLELIEPLRCDPEDYVRRSVANNLNDIGKDHPDVLLEVAARWWAQGRGPSRQLVSHALRSLVKDGHPGALSILGFSVPPQVSCQTPVLSHPVLHLGQTQSLSCVLVSRSSAPQRLSVDVVLHLVGARGQPREKVFKGKTLTLPPGATETIRWSQPLRAVSTRAYYTGPHALELSVCGQRMGRAPFELRIP